MGSQRGHRLWFEISKTTYNEAKCWLGLSKGYPSILIDHDALSCYRRTWRRATAQFVSSLHCLFDVLHIIKDFHLVKIPDFEDVDDYMVGIRMKLSSKTSLGLSLTDHLSSHSDCSVHSRWMLRSPSGERLLPLWTL